MAASIPELNLALAIKLLEAYCKENVPSHVADKIKLIWRKRGATITLIESRPDFMGGPEWTEMPIAQFRFDDGTWFLYCSDRNGKWHSYLEDDGNKDFSTSLKMLDEDQTGIFWG